MCGIFGIAFLPDFEEKSQVPHLLRSLYLLSESRGKEASGLAIRDGKTLRYAKTPFPASDLIKTHDYRKAIHGSIEEMNDKPMVFMGHSRLVTHGYEQDNRNNQPVHWGNTVVIHNGIIVNYNELWNRLSGCTPASDLDSEIIPAWLDEGSKRGKTLVESIHYLFSSLKGMASIAALFADKDVMLLATNNGSLYTLYHAGGKAFVFASERHILNAFIGENPRAGFGKPNVVQLKPGHALLLDLKDHAQHSWHFLDRTTVALKEGASKPLPFLEFKIRTSQVPPLNRSLEHKTLAVPTEFERLVQSRMEAIGQLKRCTRCILPETFPFIVFDNLGVCNYCHTHQPIQLKNNGALERLLNDYRKAGSGHDCLVPFSGGRDSSFVLHYLKREMGMNPLAFSYDWGMLTDLARRNQARMCGALGVEHILISADIRKKRDNIRKNVSAWLKRPHLGTIPLFMAGDKQYFRYAELLIRQNELKLTVMGENHLEKTGFKTMFSGARQKQDGFMAYHVSRWDKLRMLGFYSGQFLLNPAYINSSMIDTASAFLSYYGSRHDYINFFDFWIWDEKMIEHTIIKNYEWETDPGTSTTWRIGDGTAAFYNYIYLMIAGFTENDTFRSNQVREGMLTREQALERIAMENRIRWDSIQWYCNVIGIDWMQTIKIINLMKSLI